MTTQQTEQETKQALDATSAGAQTLNDGAPEGMPQWIAEAIGMDKARAKEFAAAAELFKADDFKRLKEAGSARERSLMGQVSAAKAYQSLTEEQRTDLLDAQANREEAIEVAAERGVPKDLLEDFPTAKSVRAFAKKYIASNGAAKPTAKAEGGDVDDVVARVLAAMGRPGRPASEAAQPGTKGGGAQVANIETLADGEWNPKAAADFMRASGYRS